MYIRKSMDFDDAIERAAIALDRIHHGRSAGSLVLNGWRGVGKTVLLNQDRLDGEERDLSTPPVPRAPRARRHGASMRPSMI